MAGKESLNSTHRPMTVWELNNHIRQCLEGAFQAVFVRGEVSDLTIHSSNHVYFTIKDEFAQLRCVALGYGAKARQLGLQVGIEVDVYGCVSMFEPRGDCQIKVSSIIPAGAGELHRRFEELKARLSAEGLFDVQRKRPIPSMPRVIGLVTSWTGAAIQDFFRVLNRRFSGMHVRVIPTLVQGDKAPEKLIKALEYFNETDSCDVIVLTRGGGSAEDLWCFNDENLARAIAASRLPVISAVGHERDYSISDFVADYRAATPTAAAEILVQGKAALGERLEQFEIRMSSVMRLRVSQLGQRFQRASSCKYLRHPDEWIDQLSQRLDYAGMRLRGLLGGVASGRRQRLDSVERRLPLAISRSRDKYRHRLDRVGHVLSALDPKSVLTRGYSILLDGEGRAVRRGSDVACGDLLRALLGSGQLDVVVDRVADKGSEG